MNIEKVMVGLLVAMVALQALLVVTVLSPSEQGKERLGSIPIASEQQSTSTGFFTGNKDIYLAGTTTAKNANGPLTGVLGSLIQTGTTTGITLIEFFDATTTNINERAAGMTTNSIRIASVPILNTVQPPYVFDARYYYGLIAVIKGNVVSTTITWR